MVTIMKEKRKHKQKQNYQNKKKKKSVHFNTLCTDNLSSEFEQWVIWGAQQCHGILSGKVLFENKRLNKSNEPLC